MKTVIFFLGIFMLAMLIRFPRDFIKHGLKVAIQRLLRSVLVSAVIFAIAAVVKICKAD